MKGLWFEQSIFYFIPWGGYTCLPYIISWACDKNTGLADTFLFHAGDRWPDLEFKVGVLFVPLGPHLVELSIWPPLTNRISSLP